jgi:hypothetical protein
MKRKEKRVEGVWLGLVSGLGTPGTRKMPFKPLLIEEDVMRSKPGPGFFLRPGPALHAWVLLSVF